MTALSGRCATRRVQKTNTSLRYSANNAIEVTSGVNDKNLEQPRARQGFVSVAKEALLQTHEHGKWRRRCSGISVSGRSTGVVFVVVGATRRRWGS